MNDIRVNETLQVLVFVCLPLVFLLIAVIILLRRSRRNTVVFPEFSVTINSVGRGEAYVIYHSNNRKLEFTAEVSKGKQFFTPRILVEVPKEMTEEDIREIVPDLGTALKELRYEYLVFRKRELQIVSEEEREAAVTELRQLGCETKEPVGHVQRVLVNNWHHFSGRQANTMVSKLQELVSKARGVRKSVEVLARSDNGQ